MSRHEIEDGMGFSGLAPTAAERAQDAYEDTRRKVAAAREKRLAELVVEKDSLLATLEAACGYMLNAKIDLETSCPKATAIRTIEGGLKMVRAAIAKATGK